MARVISKKGDRATVSFQKNGACGSCTACHVGEENMHQDVDVVNEVGADVGDWVEIELADSTVLNAAFILYVVPLIAFMAIMLGSFSLLVQLSVNHAEAISALTGLLAVVITYFWIKHNYNDDAKQEKYLSSITRIIEEHNEACNRYVELEENYDKLYVFTTSRS